MPLKCFKKSEPGLTSRHFSNESSNLGCRDLGVVSLSLKTHRGPRSFVSERERKKPVSVIVGIRIRVSVTSVAVSARNVTDLIRMDHCSCCTSGKNELVPNIFCFVSSRLESNKTVSRAKSNSFISLSRSTRWVRSTLFSQCSLTLSSAFNKSWQHREQSARIIFG